jgi:hypothetical protein
MLPGLVMEICPPHMHIHLPLSNKAGWFITITLLGGAHGAKMAGTQGIGVSTPIAAEVAAATCGLAIDWHMPKGKMFVIGTISIIVAINMFCAFGRKGTVTINEDGAIPKLHCSNAPIQTNFPIPLTILFWFRSIFLL